MAHHISIRKYGRKQRYKNHGWELMEVFRGDDGKLYLVTECGKVYNKIPKNNTKPFDVIETFGIVVKDN